MHGRSFEPQVAIAGRIPALL